MRGVDLVPSTFALTAVPAVFCTGVSRTELKSTRQDYEMYRSQRSDPSDAQRTEGEKCVEINE